MSQCSLDELRESYRRYIWLSEATLSLGKYGYPGGIGGDAVEGTLCDGVHLDSGRLCGVGTSFFQKDEVSRRAAGYAALCEDFSGKHVDVGAFAGVGGDEKISCGGRQPVGHDIAGGNCDSRSSGGSSGWRATDTRSDIGVEEVKSCVSDKVGVPGAFGKVQVGGINRDRNRQRRVEKKEKKIRRQERGVDSRDWRSKVPLELNDSWVARKNAENELATLKAKKDLEFQKSRDVEAETKRRRVAVMKNTERDRVAVEKAFATLKVTGNVPGFCATVVDSEVPDLSNGSGSGLSISPDSSISQGEIRAMVKECEDLRNENRRLKRVAKLEKANDYHEVAITNDGEEPSPSLREEMDERAKKYQLEYAYESGWVNGKDVLLVKTTNHFDEYDGY